MSRDGACTSILMPTERERERERGLGLSLNCLPGPLEKVVWQGRVGRENPRRRRSAAWLRTRCDSYFKSLILAHSLQPTFCMVELGWLTARSIMLAWKIDTFPDTSAHSASILLFPTCQASWKKSTEKKRQR